ncbi:MAG: hypothetical protein FJX76_09555 [Armatimonadetes bacterium]|nr:hypothetical protein [Armatimonadota bacterium]
MKRIDPKVNVIKGIGSAEGLIQELAIAEMDADEAKALREKGESAPAPQRRSLVCEDEISGFLSKAHRDMAGALIQKTVEAYDCHDTLEHTLRRGKLVAHRRPPTTCSGSFRAATTRHPASARNSSSSRWASSSRNRPGHRARRHAGGHQLLHRLGQL